jgi:hypothetical protein
VNFSALIGIYEICHCLDLRVILVWLCLLGVERVDFRSGEHVRQDKVFEDLDALWRASFVIVAEGLEEIFRSTIPLSYAVPSDIPETRE